MTNLTYVRACMTTFCPNFLCTNLSLRKVKKRKSVTYKLKYSSIDRTPFGNFNNLLMSRLLSNSLTNHSWSLDYIQQDLRWINLFCKLLSELLASSKTCHRGFDGSDRNCVFVRPRYGPRAWLVRSKYFRAKWRLFCLLSFNFFRKYLMDVKDLCSC